MTHHRIPFWIDLRHIPLNKRLPYLHVLEEVACERVLLQRGDPHVERPGLEAVTVDGRFDLKHHGEKIGRLVRMSNAKGQDKAAQQEGLVVVDAEDWRVIPLENLIAARRDRPGTLFAIARTPQQAGLFVDALETGVHGIVLAPESPQAIVEADQELRKRWRPSTAAAAVVATDFPPLGVAPTTGQTADSAKRAEPIESAVSTSSAVQSVGANGATRPFLEPALVTAVVDGGMGDRVCLDTTSLFREGEGLLVGSTARSFCLVHAETLKQEYLQPRPFRVNCGAVHLYLFAPEGKTRYLSELAAGQPVLAVHNDGIHRVLTVGRVKIERRPHTLVHWKTL
ncbi:MAG: 3-dehydroquinate synthase II, partial [Candidatus Thermoplasmatota archaeon]